MAIRQPSVAVWEHPYLFKDIHRLLQSVCSRKTKEVAVKCTWSITHSLTKTHNSDGVLSPHAQCHCTLACPHAIVFFQIEGIKPSHIWNELGNIGQSFFDCESTTLFSTVLSCRAPYCLVGPSFFWISDDSQTVWYEFVSKKSWRTDRNMSASCWNLICGRDTQEVRGYLFFYLWYTVLEDCPMW